MNRTTHAVAAIVVGLALAATVSHTPFSDLLDLSVYDWLIGHTAPPARSEQKVVIVGIGDEALDRFEEPLVMWHPYLAEVIEAAAAGGGLGLALDVILPISLSRLAPEIDRRLIRSIQGARKSGMEVYLGFSAGTGGVMPHKKFQFFVSGLGFLNVYPDGDGKIREQLLVSSSEEGREAYAISRALAGAARDTLAAEDMPRRVYIDYRLPRPEIIPFSRVYDWASEGEEEKLVSAFKDKLIIVGLTSYKLHDTHPVPVRFENSFGSHIPGAIIQALSTETVLQGRYLRDVDPATAWGLALVVGFFSGAVFLRLSPARAAATVVVLFLALSYGIYWSFTHQLVLRPSPLVFFLFIPAAFSASARSLREYRQFRRLQRYFKSYVNEAVMQEIIDNPGLISFEGHRVCVTVMFLDIRNYSTLSEKMDPQAVVAGLNRFYEEMTAAVVDNNGYLHQYLGDGIMAVFGAPNTLPDDGAPAAVRCGIDMQRRVEKLNGSEIFPGASYTLRIGVGIHTGDAVAGNIGCYEKMGYGVVGDTVNLASRIEGLTKEHGSLVLMSAETRGRITQDVECRFVGTTKVKGRSQDVSLYEVVTAKEET